MEALCSSIVCQHIGGSELVVDAFRIAPVADFCGNEFSIVSDEDLQFVACLGHHRFVPNLDRFAGFGLRSQGNAPYVTGKVIN